MEKLITLTAVAAPINVDNMDTDQPKAFFTTIVIYLTARQILILS